MQPFLTIYIINLISYWLWSLRVFQVLSVFSTFLHSIIYRFQEAVDEGKPAKWTEKKNLPCLTETYKKYMVYDVMQDFSASVLQISDQTYDQEYVY